MLKKTFVLIASVVLIATMFAGCGNIAGSNVRINEKDITPFNAVSIDTSSTRIELVAADRFGVEIFVPKRFAPEWDVTNGRLTIRDNTTNYVFSGITINNDHYVKVYYPADTTFADMTLASSSGKIDLPQVNVADLSITSSSGSINAGAEKFDNAIIESSSGDITFSGSGGYVKMTSQSGAVRSDTENCEEISVTTSSGRADLADKGNVATVLSVSTQSGRIDAKGGVWRDVTARSSSGGTTISGELLGNTYVETASGSVIISVNGSLSVYGYTLTPGSGSIHLNGERMDKPALSSGSYDNHITVTTSSGGIRLDFSS